MAIFIDALYLKNYRGIGKHPQKIGKFEKCNFFIGTNNSGKSGVLNFISAHLQDLGVFGSGASKRLNLSPLEIHLGATEQQVAVGFAIPFKTIHDLVSKKILERNVNVSAPVFSALATLLNYFNEQELIWIDMDAGNPSIRRLTKCKLTTEIRPILTDNQWQILWNAFTSMTGGDALNHWVPQVVGQLLLLISPPFPKAVMIPAIRQIGKKGGRFDDFSGEGLIDRLAELQNPSATERHLIIKFNSINSFLQEVTGNKSARIEVPHDRDEVLVHLNDRVLPLSSLGTGIHEVVMIATFCTLTEKSIVCIEEPEIHLHPILQKKLIKYILKNTDNQYFIATHSSSIIDHSGAAVFHVFQKNDETYIELASSPSHRFRICQDLGYKASDLLQTNAIIWVEGPSDRIYINHWIRSVDDSLIEGIHYSVMFYGGRLLNHLSSTDDEITEFINLRKLNGNVAIIMDSDKSVKNSKINNTKKRIISEFQSNSEPAWITAGREIENYISDAVLSNSLRKVYSSFSSVASVGRYDHRLPFNSTVKTKGVKYDVDKIKVAKEVCTHVADFTIMDLNLQVRKLVNMVRAANA